MLILIMVLHQTPLAEKDPLLTAKGHAVQEYVELHQRYLVRGEDVLNEWHMETIRRRTGSMNLHGPYMGVPEEQKVCSHLSLLHSWPLHIDTVAWQFPRS